jgi:hypothetical protein
MWKLIVLCTGIAAALGLTAARRLHSRDAQLLVERLAAHSAPVGPASDASLPAPVAKYLALALPPGRAAPAITLLEQEGELRTDGQSRRWMDFRARHIVAPQAAGFVWDAEASMAPGLTLRVIDSLVGGTGAGKVLWLSAFEVASDAGTPEINSGSLHRFLAEAVWYPWALVPSERLTWQGIDERRALATLTVHGTTVALEFRFGESGEVESIYSPGRWGSFDGGYAKVPWEGHFSSYVRRDQVLVPLYGEVGWYRGDTLEWVWKGRIKSIDWH